MSKITETNLGVNTAMRGMPDVFCLFPEVNPSRFALPASRKKVPGTFLLHSYGYDDLHRLVSAQHPAQSAVETKGETFTYDAVGNRLADANITGYQYNAANRLLSNSSYTYTHDANGNLTVAVGLLSDAVTYAYNSENQLTNVTMTDGTVVSFKYDPLGRRIEKSVQPPVPSPP